ncbi:hypothetical protein FRC10_006398, partial [Ceratobasidium sp. 414]
MHSFTRVATFIFLLLSLSFLASTFPIAPRTTTSKSKSMRSLSVAIDALVALFKLCAHDLLKVGAAVSITADAKANTVACICSIITLLAIACAQVSAKSGIVVVLSLFAKIDLCLKFLLANLNICVGGILALIAKTIASAAVGVLGQIHLSACLSVLSLGLGLWGVTSVGILSYPVKTPSQHEY